MRLPWNTKRPKAQKQHMIATPAALLRVLTWLAFPEVFEVQVPDPKTRAGLRGLAEKAAHSTSSAQALKILADELTQNVHPEVLRELAGGLGD
jgi:hypothetical protein